jgi:nicotinamide mononucleotide adenylyltransferase
MVRDIDPDEKNPFTTEQTISMMKKYFDSKNLEVIIMSIPDIESVNYGRGVGYEINEYIPPVELEMISATKIRNAIKNNDDSWKEMVDKSIHEDLIKYLTKDAK